MFAPVIGTAYTMATKREAPLVRANKSVKRRERNVRRFEEAAWGRGALRDSGPRGGCEGD